jgi:NodT family efflux transporter outer membrane factor (OMF) lipoprotein
MQTDPVQTARKAPAAAPEARRAYPLSAIALASLVLCSCAAIPDLGPAPQPVAANSLAAKNSFAAPTSEWPTQHWWASFKDAQLDELMAEAIAHSPTMAQAQARLLEADGRTGAARAALYPTVGADASVNREKLSYHSIFPIAAVPKGWNDLGQATLDFNWELDFWGKNRSALEATLSEAKEAQADAAGAELLLTTSLAERYIQLSYLYDLRDVTAQTLRNREDSARLTRERLAQGLDTEISAEEAAARVNLAQADLVQVGERIRLCRDGIAALIGAGPDRGLEIARPTMSTRREFGMPKQLSADLIGRKPEVVAARWRVESAAQRVGVARATFYPNVNLAAFIGIQSLGISKLTESGSEIGSVGPAVHLPIFEGGLLRANYRSASAEYNLAVAMYDQALTEAMREVADAAGSLNALDARRDATEAGVVRSQRAYRLAKARYEGGLADYQTVLTAEEIKLQAELADTAIHSRGYSLDVALVKALGGGFESNIPNDLEAKP